MNQAGDQAIYLPYLGVLRAEGTEVMDFLNAQLSADLRGMGPGDARWACCCDIKGRVIALLLVCRNELGAMLIGSRPLLGPLAQHLSRYILRSDVKLAHQTDLKIAGCAATAPGAYSTPDGLFYLLTESVDELATSGHEHWKSIELGHGVVWLDEESTGKFLPQMLGVENIGAVSFDKGCYPGQEVVARIHWLGKVKRTPALLEVHDETLPACGIEASLVQNDSEANASIVACAKPATDHAALFVVARGLSEGPIEAVVVDDKRWPCRRLELPAQGSATT